MFVGPPRIQASRSLPLPHRLAVALWKPETYNESQNKKHVMSQNQKHVMIHRHENGKRKNSLKWWQQSLNIYHPTKKSIFWIAEAMIPEIPEDSHQKSNVCLYSKLSYWNKKITEECELWSRWSIILNLFQGIFVFKGMMKMNWQYSLTVILINFNSDNNDHRSAIHIPQGEP
jgi:hypothetical protein